MVAKHGPFGGTFLAQCLSTASASLTVGKGCIETVDTGMCLRRINGIASLLGSYSHCTMKNWHTHIHSHILLSIKEFPTFYSYYFYVPEVIPSNLFMEQNIALSLLRTVFIYQISSHIFM